MSELDNISENVTPFSNVNDSIIGGTLKKRSWFIIAIVLVLLLLSITIYFRFNRTTLEDAETSVVKILCFSGDNCIATGSGFVAFDSQTIVTNYHVYADSDRFIVTTDSGEDYYMYDMIYCSEPRDIAILKTSEETSLKPLKFGNDKKIARGDHIIAIGSPLGFANTVSDGLVSGRFVDQSMEDMEVIQISAPISHGSSGGALFDDKYNVIGMTFAGMDEAQNLNFAIPISAVEEVYNSRICDVLPEYTDEDTLYRKCKLGFLYENLSKSNRNYIRKCNLSIGKFEDYYTADINKEKGIEYDEVFAQASHAKTIILYSQMSPEEYLIAKYAYDYLLGADEFVDLITSCNYNRETELLCLCAIGNMNVRDLTNDDATLVSNYIIDHGTSIESVIRTLYLLGYDASFDNENSKINVIW